MSKNRREFLQTAGVGVLGAGATMAMTGGKSWAAPAEGVPKEPVKIGIMAAQSGVMAPPGVAALNASQIWAEQVN